MQQQEVNIDHKNDDVAVLITVQKAAKMLSSSQSLVYDLASRGIIPGVVYIGPRSVRLDKKLFEGWIKNGCKGAQ